MKPKICIVRTQNETVTKHVFDLLARAFRESGCDVSETLSRQELFSKKYDYYLASDLLTAFKLILRRKKFFFWMQGIAPEESVIEKKSKLHYRIWSALEKLTVRKAAHVWAVSKEMIRHLEVKYRVRLSKKASVLPCYNTAIRKSSFFYEKKYESNVFVYAGGLTPWQCFDETVGIYREIEKKHDNVSLLLLVRDKERAEQIAKEKGVRNYSIDYVSPDELNERLAGAKFGFIIRKDDPVNHVATPTKISSYLSNGIVPIFTSAIRDFTALTRDKKYVLQYDAPSYSERLESMLSEKIDPNEIHKEYLAIFEEYYNDGQYLENCKREIGGIIGVK